MDAIFKAALRMGLLALAFGVFASGQQGGYSDQPPPPVAYEEPAPEIPPAPPEPPFWRRIDYSDPANLIKIALLLGSGLIARRAFRDMQ